MASNLTFSHNGSRIIMVGREPRKGDTRVLNVPYGMGLEAMRKLTRVVFYPAPREIEYDKLMSYRNGQLARS